jgi:hypothetical protein
MIEIALLAKLDPALALLDMQIAKTKNLKARLLMIIARDRLKTPSDKQESAA